MTERIEVQDKINAVVRKLSRAGFSDDAIVATLTDHIKTAIQLRRWGKPWMDAMQATRARIKREGLKVLLHN